MEYLWDIRYVTETAMNPRGASPSESRQLAVPQMAPGNPEIGINIQMQPDQCVHFLINILVT